MRLLLRFAPAGNDGGCRCGALSMIRALRCHRPVEAWKCGSVEAFVRPLTLPTPKLTAHGSSQLTAYCYRYAAVLLRARPLTAHTFPPLLQTLHRRPVWGRPPRYARSSAVSTNVCRHRAWPRDVSNRHRTRNPGSGILTGHVPKELPSAASNATPRPCMRCKCVVSCSGAPFSSSSCAATARPLLRPPHVYLTHYETLKRLLLATRCPLAQ